MEVQTHLTKVAFVTGGNSFLPLVDAAVSRCNNQMLALSTFFNRSNKYLLHIYPSKEDAHRLSDSITRSEVMDALTGSFLGFCYLFKHNF